VETAGPPDGPPVVLLHGFPEFSYAWRRQMAPLAAAGLRVLAPDMRGYGRSEKPSGLRAYALDALAADVVGLAEGPLRVVGHDWGGVVAWHVAARHPARVERLVIANAPHPAVWAGIVARRPSQFLKSTYVGFFQIPWAPERLLRANDFAAMRRALTSTSRPGTFSQADLDRYAEAWAQPGALTAMLNYYRALPFSLAGRGGSTRIAAPTLVLWGARDQFLERENATASAALCDQGEVRFFKDATHWLHLEEPEAFTAALLGFLAT